MEDDSDKDFYKMCSIFVSGTDNLAVIVLANLFAFPKARTLFFSAPTIFAFHPVFVIVVCKGAALYFCFSSIFFVLELGRGIPIKKEFFVFIAKTALVVHHIMSLVVP